MPDITIRIPAIDKLLDYTASGVGAIAGPILANWKAVREGRARIAAARADAEVREIEAGSEAKALDIIADAQAKARHHLAAPGEEVRGDIAISREDIAQSMEFQGRKRLANTRAVVNYAADELGGKEVPDHEPDPDWTARFFNEVQDVSSDEMQKIWARVLAGEVETPGRTSLRTLSILRDMSQKDAEKFSEFMKFRISDFIVGKFAEEIISGILDTVILAVVDIGLAYPSLVAYPSIKLSRNGLYDMEHHGHLLRIEGPPETEIDSMTLEAIVLTPSGKELAAFCIHQPNLEYLSRFARHVEAQKCSLKLAPIVNMSPDGRMQFSLDELRTL